MFYRIILICIATMFGMATAAVAGGGTDPAPPVAPQPQPQPIPIDKILDPDKGNPLLIGLFGGIDYNMHNGAFTIADQQMVCCTSTEGTGIGIVLGGKAFIPLTDEISISPRLLYEGRGGAFKSDTLKVKPILGTNNTVENATVENSIDMSVSTLGLDILATYTFVPSIGLYAGLGPSLSFIIANEAVFSEHIVSPAGVQYTPGGGTTSELARGELVTLNTTQFSLRGGIGASFPISSRLYLNPEVLYILPLTKFSANTGSEWKASAIQATLGILWAF